MNKPLSNSKDMTGTEVAAALFVGFVVVPLLFAGCIAWGVQPLAESFGASVPFWPALFTALLVRFILLPGANANRRQS